MTGLMAFVVLWTLTRADTDVSCVFMESCVLPCSFSSGAEIIIHWLYTAENLNVHSYYYNRDQLTNQDQRFRGRTSLFQDQISGGNASLQLTGVKVQDQGRYKCYTSTVTSHMESFINVKVDAPVTTVHLQQVGNRLTCSSEGIYPEPGVSWSTNPPSSTTSNSTTTVQQTEQLLYNISSSLMLSHDATDVDYSCTVRSTNKKRSTLLKEISLTEAGGEATIPCTDSLVSVSSLIWRFNHSLIILSQTRAEVVVSEQWRQLVKSDSGSLSLQGITTDQEGTYSCELRTADEMYIRTAHLSVSGNVKRQETPVVIIAAVAFIVAAVIIGLICYKRRTRCRNARRYNPAPTEKSKPEEHIPLTNGTSGRTEAGTSGGTDEGASSGTDEGTSGGTEARTYGGTEAGTSGGTEARTYGGTEAGTSGGTEAGASSGTDEGASSGTEAGTYGGTEARTYGGTEAQTYGGTEAGTSGGTEAGTSGGTDEGASSGTDDAW